MKLSVLPKNLPVPKDDGGCKHLINKIIPNIALLNQDGNYLRLRRNDSFRIVLYCYPMTGSPEKSLPLNWDNIPGARGCTPQTCSFRDNYDDIIKYNAIPIGLSTQTVSEIKEMVKRLMVPYDILSDSELKFCKIMNLPTFKINKLVFIKRLTLIIEHSTINKVFYPIFPPDLHIYEVIEWLKKN
tara:strand:+ start:2133 stop:2687 length:555 start_codon:yes stop_codon:yes gene_type:complete